MSFDPKCISILRPIDGDMLNKRDGILTERGLITKVEIAGPADLKIMVNGVLAVYSEGVYTVSLELSSYKSEILVEEIKNGFKECITVYLLKNYADKYRLSIDDNIWFLRDIAQNSEKYGSIFDNPFLKFYKQIHDTYGTKVHINIYYSTDDFNLLQMPDKYKEEWKENSNWMRLSFHAYADKPDKPYKEADYSKVKHDCEMVLNEIRRFAGEEILGPVTTLHWGEATAEGCRALRDLGYKCLVGDFNVDNNLSPVSFYFNVEQRRHINKRFIWRDNKEGIIFFRSAIIIDCHKKENIASFMDEIKKDPHKSPYIDLLIHEQYFYPFYTAYQPDYREKVITAVKWAVDNGYKSAFLDECVFE